jgi:hypothetical protein
MATMLGDLLKSRDVSNYKGLAPTATQISEQLNYAARFISKEIYQFDPSIAMTLTIDDGDMDLFGTAFTRDVLEVKQVIVNGIPLRAANGTIGMWSYQEVERIYPQWRTAAHGTPRIAFQLDRTLYTYPKPDAAYSNSYVSGTYLCAELTGSDTALSYDLPVELHVPTVLLAADFAADPTVAEVEGVARLQRYAARASYDIKKVRRQNMRLASAIGTTPGSSTPNFMQL